MKKSIGLLVMLVLLVGAKSQAAQLSCRAGENSMRVTVLKETGCPSGLVLLNIETMCIDATSPVFSTLKANTVYDFCYLTIPDTTKTTWMAHVLNASEVR